MTYKNREMATGAFPTGVRFEVIYLEGSWRNGGYDRRAVGKVSVVALSDGSEVTCKHPHGHKTTETMRACATRLVRDLNDAAGIPRDKQ